jgi:flagellar hook-length control protein FliK
MSERADEDHESAGRVDEPSSDGSEREKTAETSDEAVAATSGGGQHVVDPAARVDPVATPDAPLAIDPAGVIQTTSHSIDELTAVNAQSAAPFAAISAPRADLVSMNTLPSDGATAIATQPVVSNGSTALETIAIAEGEWLDDVDSVPSELAPERREARAVDSTVDRVSLSRSTSDAWLSEPTRESTAAPRAHDTDRAAEILKQIRLRLSPELRQATIHLSPPELGRLSIHLTLEDRRLTAAVRSERRETLEALGRHLPELRAALASHGIEAEQFDLALGFQNDPHAQGDPRDGERASSTHPIARVESRSSRDEPLTRALATASGVDLYA